MLLNILSIFKAFYVFIAIMCVVPGREEAGGVHFQLVSERLTVGNGNGVRS